MNTTVIIPAAGSGKRLKSKTDKPFILINGTPLIAYTLKAVAKSKKVKDIIVVTQKKHIKKIERIIKKYDLKKISNVVKGGKIRTVSVKNGLEHVSKDTDIVAVHDGARPCIATDILDNAIDAARKNGCSCVCVKVKPTIKKVIGDKIVTTIDRDLLWEAQTPQVFKKSILEKAYKNMSPAKKYTDDVSLLENSKVYIKVVTGDYRNLKVTTKQDLDIAKHLLRK